MTALLDVCSRLPQNIWYDPDPKSHDQRLWPEIKAGLTQGTLLLFDLGYTNFQIFKDLTQQGVTWITRAKRNLSYEVCQVLQREAHIHDQIVWIGQDEARQQVRLIEVLYQGKWYRYLTNEREALKLPVAYVVALYWQHWRIEDAYHVIKRLLGLAYFWSGSQNAVELQLWTTWLLYVALIDLTDDVAQAVQKPLNAISIEMVYRSLYFFAQAREQGEAQDLVIYLAQSAKSLGLLKRKPPTRKLALLLGLTNSSGP